MLNLMPMLRLGISGDGFKCVGMERIFRFSFSRKCCNQLHEDTDFL